jgi:hypothetical protein
MLIHKNNSRGITSVNDEVLAWFNNMNRYSSGSDVQQWLSMWSGKAIVVDRKSSPPIRIESPFVNVIGTIQPAALQEIAKGNKAKTGFTDRLLFVYPKGLKRKAWSNKELDYATKVKWSEIITKLLSLEFINVNGSLKPNKLTYTTEATELILEWQTNMVEEDAEYASDIRNGVSAKIETYLFRFCIVIQLLHWVCNEGDKNHITKDSVQKAILLAKYFKQTGVEVAESLNSFDPTDSLPELKKLIYNNLPASFTTGEARAVADQFDMPERTLKHWLKDKIYFKHLKHGRYERLF